MEGKDSKEKETASSSSAAPSSSSTGTSQMTASNTLSLPTSSIYSQSVSMLGSPPSHANEIGASQLPRMLSPQMASAVLQNFVSPPRCQTDVQLTSLQPVTPSRLNAAPRDLCSGAVTASPSAQSAAVSYRGLTSPPAILRGVLSPTDRLKPTISKKGKGKISITFNPNLLLSHFTNQDGSSIPIPPDCFSQFLSRSKGLSPAESETSALVNAEDGAFAGTDPAKIDHSPDPVSSGRVAETAKDRIAAEEEEYEEEERNTVTNITKALKLDVDMYTAMKKGRKARETSSKLPKEVQGLMGEANICYARGDHDSALQMCMEIIRTGPWCPEPYELLAILYEERGDDVKHLQYSLLAAHLQVGDVDNWLSLARSCEEAGFLEQAAHCYSKAMRLQPNDFQIMWAAAVTQQQLGNIHRALSLFKSVVKIMPSSNADQRMALARDIAKACHANEETALALEVMDEIACKYPDDVKYEDVNVMCELAMLSKQYRKVYDIVAKHCQTHVEYAADDLSNPDAAPSNVSVPSNLPLDLKCKCVLAAIPLGCLNRVQSLFDEVCSSDPTDYGDLQLDVADIFMETKQYQMAVHVLDILAKSRDYSLAAVWLKKGECHRELGQRADETFCIRQVVEKAPGHAKGYLLLCQVLRHTKRYKEAIEVIQDAETYELEDEEQMLLNYETFKMYNEWAAASKRRHDKLCKSADLGLLMLANKLEDTFIYTKTILLRRANREDGVYRGDVRATRKVGKYFYKHEDKKSLVAKGRADVISNEDWWNIFLETCGILRETERFIDGITLIEVALSHGQWCNLPEKKLFLQRMACSMSVLGGNYFFAYTYMRAWLLDDSSRNCLWNLFNQITVRSEDQRHHRFCLRFLIKDPESIALAVLTGHNSLATGTYKHSLGEYMRAHRKTPTNPLYTLLIGIIYIHIASQRFTTHKSTLVMQSIAFLNMYLKQRKCDQEAYYNIGRVYHQIGLSQFAMQWYKKALETRPPKCDIEESVIDLKSEIAYNLAILYRKSGNTVLATKLLREHCVV